jgi:hypothetical protein
MDTVFSVTSPRKRHSSSRIGGIVIFRIYKERVITNLRGHESCHEAATHGAQWAVDNSVGRPADVSCRTKPVKCNYDKGQVRQRC